MNLLSKVMVMLFAIGYLNHLPAEAASSSKEVVPSSQMLAQVPQELQQAINNCAARGCGDGVVRIGEKTFRFYRTNYSKWRAYEYNQFNNYANEMRELQRQQQMSEYCQRNGYHYR